MACHPARRTARWGTAVAKALVTMSDKGPVDKDVRGVWDGMDTEYKGRGDEYNSRQSQVPRTLSR